MQYHYFIYGSIHHRRNGMHIVLSKINIIVNNFIWAEYLKYFYIYLFVFI